MPDHGDDGGGKDDRIDDRIDDHQHHDGAKQTAED